MKPLVAIALMPDIDQVDPVLLQRWQLSLAADELARMGNYGSTVRQRDYVVGRVVLKALSHELLGAGFAVNVGQDGRPWLKGDLGVVSCSISHSHGQLLLGFSTCGSVGVDIEKCRPRDFEALTKTYFSAAARKEFLSLDSAQTSRWFYRHWCCREALAKLTGRGLFLSDLAAGPGDLLAGAELKEEDIRWHRLSEPDCEAVVASTGCQRVSGFKVGVTEGGGLVFNDLQIDGFSPNLS